MANKTYITTRDMLYNTRRLKAGDEFRTSARDGDILVRLGRAQRVPASLAQSAQPAPVAPQQSAKRSDHNIDPDRDGTAELQLSSTPDPLTAARAEYEAIVGKRAFHGWDESELRRRMAEHQAPPAAPVMPPIPVVQDES